jgi:hypothetical protein
VAHNEDLLATVFLKNGFLKRPDPMGNIRVVLSAGDPIGKPVGSKPLPFCPFPFVQMGQLFSFQNPEGELVQLGPFLDRKVKML